MNYKTKDKTSLLRASTRIDSRMFRNALGRFTTGVAVVTTCCPQGKFEGLTINSFASVSLDPPLILWSLKRDAPSLPGFMSAGVFTINVLSATQQDLSNQFAKPRPDKFQDIPYSVGNNGCPKLDDTLAHFECVTSEVIEAGDHMIFMGEVENFDTTDGTPLVFSLGKYRQLSDICEPC